MATLTLSVARRQARVDSVTARLNSGLIKIYTGTIPATPATAIGAQVLLGTLTFGATAFGAATAATPSVATANAITQDSSADATGTAAWARILESDGTTVVMDVDCGTSAATLILNTLSIVSGGPITCSSFTLSE